MMTEGPAHNWLQVDILVEHEGWRPFLNDLDPAHILRTTAMRHLPADWLEHFHFEVALLMTGDAAITDLNDRFRSVAQPTNVLSFPQWPPTIFQGTATQPQAVFCASALPGESSAQPAIHPAIPLGDIALAHETVEKEAVERNISVHSHATHLIIHGMLHLLGYDHDADSSAARMEQAEQDLMAGFGLPDPYDA